jgi:hypothetical protein
VRNCVDLAVQLQEALAMASMVSLRNDLSVETGEWWSFNWVTNVITIPEEELECRPPERIAWIILHEAAHAALTRFHQILPDGFLQRDEIQRLLNCVEDLRIEEWLVERFPGSRPWRRISRDLDDAEWSPPGPTQRPEDVMHSFLRGLLKLGESNEWIPGLEAQVLDALRAIQPALQKAIACRPPTDAPDTDLVSRLYATHPVAGCYRDWDSQREPEPFEKWVRIMQASSWAHIAGGILPEYLRLLDLQPHRGVQLVLKSKAGGHRPGTKAACEAQMREALRCELAQLEASPYHRAVLEHAETIRMLSEQFAELLPNHRGLRHQRGLRSGERVDLRAAFQAEANPRYLDRIWMQRLHRTLPDPAFVLVVDRSESMGEMGRARAAFSALVVLREACARAGIPLSVIVFSDGSEVIHGWDSRNDERSKASLGMVLRVDGGTCLLAAIELAGNQIAMRCERDRFVVVLTDGMIDAPQMLEVRRMRSRIEASGVRFAAIGLGDDVSGIQSVFPRPLLLRESDDLPGVMGRLLVGLMTE